MKKADIMDFLPLNGTDYIEFYVSNAEQDCIWHIEDNEYYTLLPNNVTGVYSF